MQQSLGLQWQEDEDGPKGYCVNSSYDPTQPNRSVEVRDPLTTKLRGLEAPRSFVRLRNYRYAVQRITSAAPKAALVAIVKLVVRTEPGVIELETTPTLSIE